MKGDDDFLVSSRASSPRTITALAPETTELRRRLLALAPVLMGQLEADQSRSVRQLVDSVRTYSPKIAVIGQMKAGKSSFANALAGRPWLLPTNVNPWTTAVTRLHFGHHSGRTEEAQYEFFSQAEWRELLETGGHLKVVASRLLPDFDLDVLRSQLTEVRAKAQRRLGPDFARLLGTFHTYPSITTDQVARYVTAGDDAADANGVYSDVTKSADLYFGAEPFGLPLTLIDTPGTNDPFLVRDEFTLRSIEDVMVAVVVISARQPLTTSDLTLLRTISGINKERVVVFINRCDELDDPVVDGERIRAHVSTVLQREFGHAMPVVLGSAMWGNYALAPRPAKLNTVLKDSFAAVAASKKLATREQIERWQKDPDSAPWQRVADVMLAVSGIPELLSHLSTQLDTGPFGTWVRHVYEYLTDLCLGQEGRVRYELQSLEESVKRIHYDIMSAGLETQHLRAAAERLESASRKLERAANERASEVLLVQEQGIERLRQTLLARIDEHIERERANHMRALDEFNASRRPLRLDVSRLRQELEQTYLQSYRLLHTQILQVQTAAVQSFHRIIAEELPKNAIELRVDVMSGSFTYPSLTGIWQVSAFDVDPKLWARWRKNQKSLGAAVEAFEALLRDEFGRIVDRLTTSAQAQISGPASMLRHKLDHALSHAIRSVHQRHADVAARLERLMDTKSGDRVLGEHLEHLASARHRLVNLQRLSRTLVEQPITAPGGKTPELVGSM